MLNMLFCTIRVCVALIKISSEQISGIQTTLDCSLKLGGDGAADMTHPFGVGDLGSNPTVIQQPMCP